MSLSQENMIDLMAYADGELEGTDLARVEALLEKNEEARDVVASLQEGAVSSWLVRSQEERAVDSGADGIAAAVMAKVATPNVVSLDDARAKRSMRVRVIAAGVAVAALAAGVMLYARADRAGDAPLAKLPPVETGAPAPLVIPPAPSQEEKGIAVAEQPASGVEVNGVESPSNEVSVFYLPAAKGLKPEIGAASVVIWIGDDKGQN